MNKIILGDVLQALNNLPDNCVDVGVTSPPYNKGEKQKGWLVSNVEYDNIADKKKRSSISKGTNRSFK